MKLLDLRVFQTVADLGSLHSAAESLDVTQPAVSKAVRRLETSLGVQLFERTARGVALTAIGKVLYARNATLLQAADEIPREIQDLKIGKAHQLRVGAVPGLMNPVLCPALFESLQTGIPSSFSVHVQLTGTLLRELTSGQLDFALTYLLDDVSPDLAYTVLGEQRVHVVGRADHPLLRRSFGPADLMAYPWILPSSDSAPYNWLKAVFTGLGMEVPAAFIRTDSSTLALSSLVARSDALTVMLAGSFAGRGHSGLRALPLPVEYYALQVALCWRRTAYLSAAMRKFRQQIVQAFAQRDGQAGAA